MVNTTLDYRVRKWRTRSGRPAYFLLTAMLNSMYVKNTIYHARSRTFEWYCRLRSTATDLSGSSVLGGIVSCYAVIRYHSFRKYVISCVFNAFPIPRKAQILRRLMLQVLFNFLNDHDPIFPVSIDVPTADG